MQYISPFTSLGLDADLSKIDARLVRRLKKEYLAEFELQERALIDVSGKALDKNDILELFDQLENEQLLAFHFDIFKNKSLLLFLEEGNLDLFYQNKINEISYEPLAFKNFVAPYFATQFSKHLISALRNRNAPLVELLTRHSLPLPAEFKSSCYQPAYRYLISEVVELEEVTSGNLKEQSIYIIFDKNIADYLNPLPDYFADIRIRMGNLIEEVAKKFQDEYEDRNISKKLLQLGLALKTNEAIRYRLQYMLDQINEYPMQYWGSGTPAEPKYQNPQIVRWSWVALLASLLYFAQYFLG